MQIINCEQGSPEWFAERCGLATASEFSSILAKGQGKTRASYLRKIVAERLTGVPAEHFKNGYMDRGHEYEPLARAEYEYRREVTIETIGLIKHDHIDVACSPDGLVGNDGGVEIKSVIPTTQVETILGGCVPSEHKAQVQGNIWISGRKWWDFVSFCPEMPPELRLFVVRCEPDRKYIETLSEEVCRFNEEVVSTIELIRRVAPAVVA